MKLRFKDINKFKPVEIDVKNKNVYAQIAYLVDSPTFLEMLQTVRSKYEITSPFKDLRDWDNFLLKKSGFDLDEYYKNERRTDGVANPHDSRFDEKIVWLKTNEDKFLKHANMLKMFFDDIEVIRNTHHYPEMFDSVIINALLFQKIKGFSSASNQIFWGDTIGGMRNDDSAKIGIFITPYTIKEDVIKAFNEAKKNLKSHFEAIFPIDQKLDNDTVTNIVRDRTWHWKQIEGMTYAEITDEWNDKLEDDSNLYIEDSNKLEQAVARYRRNLRTSSEN